MHTLIIGLHVSLIEKLEYTLRSQNCTVHAVFPDSSTSSSSHPHTVNPLSPISPLINVMHAIDADTPYDEVIIPLSLPTLTTDIGNTTSETIQSLVAEYQRFPLLLLQAIIVNIKPIPNISFVLPSKHSESHTFFSHFLWDSNYALAQAIHNSMKHIPIRIFALTEKTTNEEEYAQYIARTLIKHPQKSLGKIFSHMREEGAFPFFNNIYISRLHKNKKI